MRDYDMAEKSAAVERYRSGLPEFSFERFWYALEQWSEKTFGPRELRGPDGPLDHLEKELKEVKAKKYDIEEYADLVFLVFDAARRAGFDYHEMTSALEFKRIKNFHRTWPDWKKSDLSKAIEHDRSKD